jgi:hypothetical protein
MFRDLPENNIPWRSAPQPPEWGCRWRSLCKARNRLKSPILGDLGGGSGRYFRAGSLSSPAHIRQ